MAGSPGFGLLGVSFSWEAQELPLARTVGAPGEGAAGEGRGPAEPASRVPCALGFPGRRAALALELRGLQLELSNGPALGEGTDCYRFKWSFGSLSSSSHSLHPRSLSALPTLLRARPPHWFASSRREAA